MDQKIFDQLTPYLGQISFGGIAGFAVGKIVTDSMSQFGEALAHRLKQVNV